MSNLFLAFSIIFIFFILIFLLLISNKGSSLSTKISSFSQLKSTRKDQEYNPDINTNNWDLHKIRLNQFGRSQYKGLTFFITSENRIYYLSKIGTKVYC